VYYARFFTNGSDVQVFESNELLVCSGCSISIRDRYATYDREHMLMHLFMHRKTGDTVPQDTIERLRAEILGTPYETAAQRPVRWHHDRRSDRVRMVDEVVASGSYL